MINRRSLLSGTAASLFVAISPAFASGGPIRIGDVNSYSKFPQATDPYRNGWTMAVQEINAAGGVLGRKLEVLSRDDGGSPATALRAVGELVSRDHAEILMGGGLSSTALAISSFAKENKLLYISPQATSDELVLQKGNRFTIHSRTGANALVGMLMDDAKGKGLGKRWVVVVPNYEFGQQVAAATRRRLAADFPGAEIVAEQFPAFGNIDAGATVQALLAAKPDVIVTCLFGSDLLKFVREGTSRGLFENAKVLGILTGQREFLAPLKDEAPVGWRVTGYPAADIKTPEHLAFARQYQASFKVEPGEGALFGYSSIRLIEALIRKAGNVQTDALVAAIDGITYPSPLGELIIRGPGNEGGVPTFVGTIALRNGEGYMTDWHQADTAKYLFSAAEVKASRSAD
jgi:branched-chain amino acid transport system substrate-binding protein